MLLLSTVHLQTTGLVFDPPMNFALGALAKIKKKPVYLLQDAASL
jgi:hypothetical protein